MAGLVSSGKTIELGCGCSITKEDSHNFRVTICQRSRHANFQQALLDARQVGDDNFNRAYRMWAR